MKKHITFVKPLFLISTILFLIINIYAVGLMLFSMFYYSMAYILPFLIFVVIIVFNILLLYSLFLKGIYIKDEMIMFDRDIYDYRCKININEIETIEIVDKNHDVMNKELKNYNDVMLIFYLKSGRKKVCSVEYMTDKNVRVLESLFLKGKRLNK